MREISQQRKLKESQRKFFNVTNASFSKYYFLALSVLIHIFRIVLKMTFLYRISYRQSQALELKKYDFYFNNLPTPFDGCRILFMSDFHINTAFELEEKIYNILNEVQFDICMLGGDYSYKNYEKDMPLVKSFIFRLTENLKGKCENIYAVLGNHDRYEIAKYMDSIKINVLMNESVPLTRLGEEILLSGVDDSVYHKADNLSLCDSQISNKASFKILLSHSPDIYEEAEKNGYSLMLSGHTHGGQFCYPSGKPVVSNATVPLSISKGRWQYKKLSGMTSNGVGCSAFPGRLFCPPEINLITLKAISLKDN